MTKSSNDHQFVLNESWKYFLEHSEMLNFLNILTINVCWSYSMCLPFFKIKAVFWAIQIGDC